MRERATPYLRGLWVGAFVFIAGIARDLQWHATHDEFEATSQQFEAHWLLWIGFLAVLVAAVLAFVRLSSTERPPGFSVVLGASAVYLPVTVWHFIAHANESDPGVAHVLLEIGDATIIAGAAWTLLAGLRAERSMTT
jgi:F0F1-type ATP synthase assembly protein I